MEQICRGSWTCAEWINSNNSPPSLLPPLRAEGAGSGKQVESVGLASRPGAAGRRKGGGLVLHLLFLCLYVTYVLVNWNHM